MADTMGYVTWSSMMSGLRSQREKTITWVSLRSGMASRATCFIDHQPAMQAAATRAKTMNLLFTEKSMMRLIILNTVTGSV